MQNLEATIASYAWMAIGAGILILTVLSLVALRVKPLRENQKKVLFLGMVFAIVLPTLYLITSTIYLNTISESKGPVHWHADIEIWACGEQQELKDPKGLSNKIGTSTLHEHNDKRIHLEGVVVESHDASLGNFFSVIGGFLGVDSVTVPTEGGEITYSNGDACLSGEQGELQVFVYSIDGQVYYQEKLADPASFIMAPESAVPPGNCVIIEFDSPKDRTEHLCQSYRVAEEIGKLEGEVANGL